jgi:hypothetical protein
LREVGIVKGGMKGDEEERIRRGGGVVGEKE